MRAERATNERRRRGRSRPAVVAALLGSMACVGALVGLVTPASGRSPAAEAAGAQAQEPRLLLNHEHVDALDVDYENGQLHMDALADLDSANDQDIPTDDVVLQIMDMEAARAQVPDPAVAPGYEFLGPAGTPLWLAPVTEVNDLVWPGWSTEDIGVGQLEGDVVDMHLRGVEGPGYVEVFYDVGFGEVERVWSSRDAAEQSYTQRVHSHVHSNWAFSALGTYTLTFEVTGTPVGGTEVSTGLHEYQFVVGSLPTTTTSTASPASAAPGEPVTLSAAVSAEAIPDGGMGGIVTFSDGTTVLGAAEVSDGMATLTTSTLAVGDHQITAAFVPDPDVWYLANGFTGSEHTIDYTVGGSGPDPTTPDPTTPDPTTPDPTTPDPTTPDPTTPDPTTPDPDPTTPGSSSTTSSTSGSGSGNGNGSGSGSGSGSGGTVCRTTTTTSGSGSGSGSGAGSGSGSGSGSNPGGGGSSSDDEVTLDAGHVDYAARIVDGDLVSEIKDTVESTTPVWRDPADVTFHLKPEAETQVPAGSQFGFLGAAGSPIWQIPQTQDPNLLWLGWNTEEIAAGDVPGTIEWTLDSVEGPGELAVYVLGSFGAPTVIFDSDGSQSSYDIPRGVHAHGNWAFTAEGTYEVTFTHTAELASGETASDTATVTFTVGSASAQSLRSASASTPDAQGIQGFAGRSDATPVAVAPVSAAAPAQTDNCTLPYTGSDPRGLLIAGAVLLVGGGLLTVAARRRLRHVQRPASS